MDEAFYNSLSSGFSEACKMIRQEQLETYFRIWCQELISKSFDFGWGWYGDLKAAYREYLD